MEKEARRTQGVVVEPATPGGVEEIAPGPGVVPPSGGAFPKGIYKGGGAKAVHGRSAQRARPDA
jgi:hypothetical protein